MKPGFLQNNHRNGQPTKKSADRVVRRRTTKPRKKQITVVERPLDAFVEYCYSLQQINL
jgi:hypothetical protein